MTSNDSGVDTSNDSNDGAAAVPQATSLASLFERQLKEGFALPLPQQSRTIAIKNNQNCSGRWSRIKSLEKECSTFNRKLTFYFNNEPRERKLRTAVTTHNTELVTKLLQSGTDPNCADGLGRTPLHLAACLGYADIVEKLLEHGASPNKVDSLENTPLHLAVISAGSPNSCSVIRLLVVHGANVEALDQSGKNPLQLLQSKIRLMRSRYTCSTPEEKEMFRNLYSVMNRLIIDCYKQRSCEDSSRLWDRFRNIGVGDMPDFEIDNLLSNVQQLSITKQ